MMTEDLLINCISIDKRCTSITGLLTQSVEHAGADNVKVMSLSLIQVTFIVFYIYLSYIL